MVTRSDRLNWLFSRVINVPELATISLDLCNVDAISTDVVTPRNVWNVLVLMSMLTKNSGACILHRDDIVTATCTCYNGEDVIRNVKKQAIYLSGTRNYQTVDVILDTSLMRCDALNALFNNILELPSVTSCTLDLHNVDRINGDIVTLDDVWSLCTLMSLLTSNSGASELHRREITSGIATEYIGDCALILIKDCVRYVSGKPVGSTLDNVLVRIGQ